LRVGVFVLNYLFVTAIWVFSRYLNISVLNEIKYRHRFSLIHKASLDDIFEPVREAYEEMTGFKNMHQNAIWHHKLSLLGPDGPNCGKPLRTPAAKLCPECGWKKKSKK
jgi:hypothetical protein